MLSCIDSLQIETDLLLEMQRRKFGMNVLRCDRRKLGTFDVTN